MRILIAAVMAAACALLLASTALAPLRPEVLGHNGLLFWTVLTILASALPVRMGQRTFVSVSMAPILAAGSLGGPLAAGVVAAIGSTEWRELRGRIPWYGTLYNHAALIIPAIGGAWLYELLAGGKVQADPRSLLAAVGAGAAYFIGNVALVAISIGVRDGRSAWAPLKQQVRTLGLSVPALATLAWLMALLWTIEWWTVLLFALPLYTQRRSYALFAEIRDMFTQTVRSLSSAVDAKDKFTSGHSERVQLIAVDIGREMRCSEPELQNLEWGGLLHDIGKIGVPDAVLLKQGALTKEERTIMNMHPVKGEDILRPVAKLTEERRIIRHHHEWYNGSGYPDHLVGEGIPKLARILHVADAFEAMTAQRPYRMTPLTAQKAMAEIRRFTGIQFDPIVVDAFTRTKWVADVPEQPQAAPLRPVPLLGQEAALRARATATEPSVTGPA